MFWIVLNRHGSPLAIYDAEVDTLSRVRRGWKGYKIIKVVQVEEK